MLKRLLASLLLLLSAVPALAEAELHVVGVDDGPRSMMTNEVARTVLVALDRRYADVTLVLSSCDGVDWAVSTTPGTADPAFVLSQINKDDGESTIRLNGRLVTEPRRVTLPLTWRPEGDDFRKLVRLVPDLFGVDRMASYSPTMPRRRGSSSTGSSRMSAMRWTTCARTLRAIRCRTSCDGCCRRSRTTPRHPSP